MSTFGKCLPCILILLMLFIKNFAELTISEERNSLLSLSSINVNFFLKFYNINESTYERDLPCSGHLAAISEGLIKLEKWSLEFIDSWGKFPDGILYGNMASMGNFDECLAIHVNNRESGQDHFRGKYCLAKIPVASILKSLKENSQVPRTDFDEFMENSNLQMGICIPSSCQVDYLNKHLLELVESNLEQKINSPILTDKACSIDEEVKFGALDWIAVGIFSFVGVIILLSTIYEYIRRQQKAQCKFIFTAFSVIKNGEKMFQIQNSKTLNSIDCLHGIRVLSLIWIVFGHTYDFLISFPALVNFLDFQKWLQSPFSMILQSSSVSVDSFFLLSGLLVAWVTMHRLTNTNGSLNIFAYYLHRFLRLTPILAALILFCVTFAKHLGRGPMWQERTQGIVQNCEKNWWSALLYIQNYVNPLERCIGPTWYLSIDMQLFLFSPVFLLGLWKWEWKFFSVIILIMLSSIVYVFAITLQYEFPLLALSRAKAADKMTKVYIPTHTRMSPWFFGLSLGYFLFKRKNKRFKLSKITILSGWIMSLSTIVVILFGPYPKTQPGAIETTLEAALYESFSRTSWAVALGWIIFACHRGYGGLINVMLSCPLWQPLSRLSYSIYLISGVFQTIVLSQKKAASHFSDFEQMMQFWADFGFTALFSIVASLAFEAPIMELEKLIFPQRNTKINKDHVNFSTTLRITQINEQDPLN